MDQISASEPRLRDRSTIVILMVQESLRRGLSALLRENGYLPQVAANPGDVMQLLRKKQCATVFVDGEAVDTYGPGMCSKFKVACPYCRVVLLCDKSLESHRRIIKETMEIGIYACLLLPYENWEVLTMVSYYPRV
jgi:DNA-binding NtrC family response regulator